MTEKSDKRISVSEITTLEKFDGSNYECWKATMFFYMAALKICCVLERGLCTWKRHTGSNWRFAVYMKEGDIMAEIKKRQTGEQDNFMCKGHILNALSNSLYNVYEPISTDKMARELWMELKNKYKT